MAFGSLPRRRSRPSGRRFRRASSGRRVAPGGKMAEPGEEADWIKDTRGEGSCARSTSTFRIGMPIGSTTSRNWARCSLRLGTPSTLCEPRGTMRSGQQTCRPLKTRVAVGKADGSEFSERSASEGAWGMGDKHEGLPLDGSSVGRMDGPGGSLGPGSGALRQAQRQTHTARSTVKQVSKIPSVPPSELPSSKSARLPCEKYSSCQDRYDAVLDESVDAAESQGSRKELSCISTRPEADASVGVIRSETRAPHARLCSSEHWQAPWVTRDPATSASMASSAQRR
mmetsp:Transcript_125386/g.297682  ORF Transcript_125386/g.297682 Transcript_125386/m.297682 type:complete len:284 (-) Transcript_125386:5-856(-)